MQMDYSTLHDSLRMRGLAALLAALMLAGCAGQAAPAPQPVAESPPPEVQGALPGPMPPDPILPRALGEGTAKAMAGACLPVELPSPLHCRTTAVMMSHVSFHPFENESALARQGEAMEWVIVAEWTPTYPNAATLGITVSREFEVIGHAEGSSPLELRLAADELSPMDKHYLKFVPTSGVALDQSVRYFLDLRPVAAP